MTWLRLGWRSIWRNRRRTLISMSAVGIGLFLAIIYVGFTDGMLKDASKRMDRTGLGHVQIHAPQFRTERDVLLNLEKPAALLSSFDLPQGTKVSTRVLTPGLLTSSWGSRGVQVLGVEPEAEREVSLALRDIVEGEALRADDHRGILIGKKMAKRLKLKVGSKVIATAQRPGGELGTSLLRVRGIFGGVSQSMSGGVAYVTTAAAQTLIGIPEATHEVIIFLEDSKKADTVAAAMRTTAGPGVEILSLSEFLPIFKTMEEMMETFIWAVVLVVYLLVGLGILNTMLMSVLERTREFGVMMAVGTPPKRVVGQVLGEAAWVATLAVLGGLVLGLAVNAYGETHGLVDYTKELGAVYEMGGLAFDSQVRTHFSIPRALQTAGVVWVLTMLVAVYPAWRVSKLQPAEALRRV